ncbi:acyltransferase family protein [Paenibacillus sp. GYB003]|uniref:acyltransferase family protein n=1 Tax=Paenibacillus sp. GYB003 TaxID=2994392 RepID=UPI002F961DCC
MPKPNGVGRYMPGLDGLRAIAVMAVIAYHLDPSAFPGGLLGVGVFFVLSGYLITDLLAAEWRTNGRLALKPFLLRRARRLLPALFVMLAAVGLWLLLADPSRLASLRGDAIAAVLYASNWWFVYRDVSYFESFGPPSPLGHLWSLAVEEQFYLLFPFALAFGLRFAPQRGKLFALLIAGALASALAMALLYEPGTDPSRVYYGTDTRAFGLLIGAALAVVWPSAKPAAGRATPAARRTLDCVGAAGLLAVLYMMARTSEYDASLYRGGMVALSVAAAAVVAALAHPAARLGRLLGMKPLRWLGVRSYGIYLWHFPVIALTKPAVRTGGIDWPLAAFQLAATLVLAALSWRFVEEPIRRGAIRKRWMLWRNRKRTGRRGGRTASIAVAGSLIAIAVFGIGATRLYPPATASSVPAAEAPLPHEDDPAGVVAGVGAGVPSGPPADQTAGPAGSSGGKPKPGNPADTGGKPKPKPETVPGSAGGPGSPDANGSGTKPLPPHRPETETGEEAAAKPDPAAPPDTKDGKGKGITVIGDSVILDAKPYLEKLLPGIEVDGKIGRQLVQAADIVDAMKTGNKLGDRVIIELGTNGAFPRKKLEALLASIGKDRQIVLVNTRVPRPWESEVNATLAEVAKSHPNATLIDWYSASAEKDHYFSQDGVHLNAEGAEAYASLVADALGHQAAAT